MVINENLIKDIYRSVLNGNRSYAEADRWAWETMQLFDDGKLSFEPDNKEDLFWELIQYLYGIDTPSMEDRTKTARSDIDIKDFLKEKGILI